MLIKNIKLYELENYLKRARTIGKGNFGRVLYMDDNNLIKVSNRLYNYINPNYGEFEVSIKDCFKNNFYSYVDTKQLEYYSLVQKDVHLTKFPKGVLLCKDKICGIILPYHKDHYNLINLTHVTNYEINKYNKTYSELYTNKLEELVLSLKRLLYSLKELEDHRIAQTDLTFNYCTSREFNVLVKDSIPQIIDFDSYLVEYDKLYNNSRYMYFEFIEIIKIIIEIIGIDITFNSLLCDNYETCFNIVEEIESKLKEKRLIK